jgi:hypothetical protein
LREDVTPTPGYFDAVAFFFWWELRGVSDGFTHTLRGFCDPTVKLIVSTATIRECGLG